jgi:hypothetical protein
MSNLITSGEKMWELYEKIPKELQNVVFSEDTDEKISTICKNNKIENEQTIIDLVQGVLLGVLPPENTEKELIERGIKKTLSKIVAEQIQKNIFLPVEESIKKLYNKQWKPEQKNNSTGPDNYREPIK